MPSGKIYGPGSIPLVPGMYLDHQDSKNNGFTVPAGGSFKKQFGPDNSMSLSAHDGRLRLDNPSRGRFISTRSLVDNGPYQVIFQTDGNLCVYDKNKAPLWCSMSNGLGGRYLPGVPDAPIVISCPMPALVTVAVVAAHQVDVHLNANDKNHHHGDEAVKRFVNANPVKRIGIIGAGVGGASCAYYLEKCFGADAEITLFERHLVGGRAHAIEIDGGMVEVGGSIVHPLNDNINNIVRDLELEVYFPEKDSSGYTIWDGNRFVFQQSAWFGSTLDKLRILYNYGWDPIKFSSRKETIVQKFLSGYNVEQPFNSVQEFFDTIGLPNITRVTAGEYFEKEIEISKPFVEELLSAAIRVNYNQDYDKIAAFAAFIALVGAEDGLYAIKGGNFLMAKGLIKKANARVVEGTVKIIRKIVDDDKVVLYQVVVAGKEGEEDKVYEFDNVVMASPIELAGVEFENVNIDDMPKKQYKTVHTYLIAATSLSPTYFSIAKGDVIPEHVLTSHNTSLPFFVASRNPRGVLNDGRILFKVFSHLDLDDAFLSTLFVNHTSQLKHAWQAYPVLTPTSEFPRIVIDEGLYYINAFEHSVSTMETETLASKNVAKLIAKASKKSFDKLVNSYKL
eukprot:gene16690-19841_t